jgi:hypothetical protein
MSSAGRRAISLQPSRHFGFITPSPKGIRNYFATHDLTIDPNLERLFALTMNATTVEIPSSPRGDVFAPVRGRGGHQKGRGRRGRAALKGITNETHAGCDL